MPGRIGKMVIYPFSSPIILNTSIFTSYGGRTGTFTANQLQNSYLVAEMQVSQYIGTLLLPTVVTGTYPYMNSERLVTDYGYVSRLLAVNVLSKKAGCTTCSLQDNDGCGYIYEDTYGYIDFKQVQFICGGAWWGGWYGGGYPPPYIQTASYPYQIQLTYEAGLPTGTANLPGVLEALTIMAQIDLNEKDPGNAGVNEGVGDIGIQRFSSMDYSETRRDSSMKRTALGNSAKAMRAALLLDNSIRKARRALRM